MAKRAEPKDGKRGTLTLLRAIRDLGMEGRAERALLDALALRANADKDFLCWPSYARLAKDTAMNPETLKKAAKRLENKGLIHRVQRQQQSNKFYVRYDTILGLANERREAEKLEKLRKQREDYDEEVQSGEELEDELLEDDNDNNNDDQDALYRALGKREKWP